MLELSTNGVGERKDVCKSGRSSSALCNKGGYHRRDTCSTRGNLQELKSASSPVRFTYKG